MLVYQRVYTFHIHIHFHWPHPEDVNVHTKAYQDASAMQGWLIGRCGSSTTNRVKQGWLT